MAPRKELSSIAELTRKYMKIYSFLDLDEDDRPYCTVCFKYFPLTRKNLSSNISCHRWSKYHRKNIRRSGLDRRNSCPSITRSASVLRQENRVGSSAEITIDTDDTPEPEEQNQPNSTRTQSNTARLESGKTASEKQNQTESEPAQSGPFDDLSFDELRSPLLSTYLENLEAGLNHSQIPDIDGLDYEEVKSLFDNVLKYMRAKVGDQDVGSLLWKIILRVRTIKTENGDYALMLKL